MFEVPQNMQEQFRGSMSDNKGVKLPFPAPTMWWMNGNVAFKGMNEIEDARRFGGFGVSKEDIEELGMPPAVTWKLHELTNKNGKTYEAYLCRTAWVAPIAKRFTWFENEGKWRSAVNILAYLAIMDANKKLTPYGAVVLSAKGYSGQELEKCFKNFASETSELRGGTLPNFFFHPIGTWGKEVVSEEKKGKGGKSFSITPAKLYVPEDGYTADLLKQWFIPSIMPEIMEDMASYKSQAQEWLEDWNKRKDETKTNAELENANAELPPEEEIPY